MSVRSRVVALALWSVVVLAALSACAALALAKSGYLAERVARVHERLVVLAAIDGAANQYGENVAGVLLRLRNRADSLQTSRVALERHFARLSDVTSDQIGALAAVGEVQAELPELDNSRRMTELYHSVDRSTTRMMVLMREGQQEQARQVFDLEVGFRLSNELQPLIDSELEGERKEVAEAESEARAAQQNFILAAAVTGGIGLMGLAVLGTGAVRAISRQEALEASRIASLGAALGEGERRVSSLEMRRAQFLADISHELRTPVTILRGEAEVGLRGSPGRDELRDTLERVQAQASELGELLEDFIGYARADSEEQEFRPAVLPVAGIVAAAAEDGAALAEPREVTVATALNDDGILVEVDERRLKRVLLIGIDNAVKHSAPGGVVTIETVREQQDVVIRVLDEGTGVAEDERGRVFERFFRGRGERELQNRGIGIGLAIARDIVALHKGRISLDNRPEGGAVLSIALPRREGP